MSSIVLLVCLLLCCIGVRREVPRPAYSLWEDLLLPILIVIVTVVIYLFYQYAVLSEWTTAQEKAADDVSEPPPTLSDAEIARYGVCSHSAIDSVLTPCGAQCRYWLPGTWIFNHQNHEHLRKNGLAPFLRGKFTREKPPGPCLELPSSLSDGVGGWIALPDNLDWIYWSTEILNWNLSQLITRLYPLFEHESKHALRKKYEYREFPTTWEELPLLIHKFFANDPNFSMFFESKSETPKLKRLSLSTAVYNTLYKVTLQSSARRGVAGQANARGSGAKDVRRLDPKSAASSVRPDERDKSPRPEHDTTHSDTTDSSGSDRAGIKNQEALLAARADHWNGMLEAAKKEAGVEAARQAKAHTEQLAQLQDQISRLTDDTAQTNRDRQTAQDAVNEMAKKVAKLTAENAAMISALSRATEACNEGRRQSKDHKEEKDSLEAIIVELRADAAEAYRGRDTVEQERDELLKTVAKMTEEHAATLTMLRRETDVRHEGQAKAHTEHTEHLEAIVLGLRAETAAAHRARETAEQERDNALKTLETRIAKHAATTDSLAQAYATKLEAFKAELRDERDGQVAFLIHEHDIAMNEVKKQLADLHQEMATQEANVAAEVTILRDNHAFEVEQYAASNIALSQQHLDEVAFLQVANHAQISSLQAQLQSMRQQHEATLNALREQSLSNTANEFNPNNDGKEVTAAAATSTSSPSPNITNQATMSQGFSSAPSQFTPPHTYSAADFAAVLEYSGEMDMIDDTAGNQASMAAQAGGAPMALEGSPLPAALPSWDDLEGSSSFDMSALATAFNHPYNHGGLAPLWNSQAWLPAGNGPSQPSGSSGGQLGDAGSAFLPPSFGTSDIGLRTALGALGHPQQDVDQSQGSSGSGQDNGGGSAHGENTSKGSDHRESAVDNNDMNIDTVEANRSNDQSTQDATRNTGVTNQATDEYSQTQQDQYDPQRKPIPAFSREDSGSIHGQDVTAPHAGDRDDEGVRYSQAQRDQHDPQWKPIPAFFQLGKGGGLTPTDIDSFPSADSPPTSAAVPRTQDTDDAGGKYSQAQRDQYDPQRKPIPVFFQLGKGGGLTPADVGSSPNAHSFTASAAVPSPDTSMSSTSSAIMQPPDMRDADRSISSVDSQPVPPSPPRIPLNLKGKDKEETGVPSTSTNSFATPPANSPETLTPAIAPQTASRAHPADFAMSAEGTVPLALPTAPPEPPKLVKPIPSKSLAYPQTVASLLASASVPTQSASASASEQPLDAPTATGTATVPGPQKLVRPIPRRSLAHHPETSATLLADASAPPTPPASASASASASEQPVDATDENDEDEDEDEGEDEDGLPERHKKRRRRRRGTRDSTAEPTANQHGLRRIKERTRKAGK